jgi:hypothetical protein
MPKEAASFARGNTEFFMMTPTKEFSPPSPTVHERSAHPKINPEFNQS